MRVTCAFLAGLVVALGLPFLAFNGISFVAVAPYMGASLLIVFFGLGAHYMSGLSGLMLFGLSFSVLARVNSTGGLSTPLVLIALASLLIMAQGVVALYQYRRKVQTEAPPSSLKRAGGCFLIVIVLQLVGIAFLAQVEMKRIHLDLATNPVVVAQLGELERVSLDWFHLRQDKLFHLYLVGSKGKASAFVEPNAESMGPRYLGILKVSDKTYQLLPTLYVP